MFKKLGIKDDLNFLYVTSLKYHKALTFHFLLYTINTNLIKLQRTVKEKVSQSKYNKNITPFTYLNQQNKQTSTDKRFSTRKKNLKDIR